MPAPSSQVVCLAMCLVLASVGCSNVPESGPGIYGSYVGAGCPTAADLCLPTTSGDTLDITEQAGAPHVALAIAFEAGQSCSMQGATRKAGDTLVLQADGLDPSKPCELTLTLDNEVVALRDQDERCRDVYCGTRGSLDGSRFRKRPYNYPDN
jgi:hypothetical protein